MRPGKPFSLLVLLVVGCLSPVTKRLETTNEQLALTNQHLAAINEKMRETNARTIEMNQHLITTNEQLSETNRRLAAIEKGLPRLPRFGASEQSVPPREPGSSREPPGKDRLDHPAEGDLGSP
jgi:septal ring factor EnvC (AmiA/AmiB activator)